MPVVVPVPTPWRPDSDEPTMSTIVSAGSNSVSSRLIELDSTAPPTDDVAERRCVVLPGAQLLEQRSSERVADDVQRTDSFTLDGSQDVRRVEMLWMILQHDRATARPGRDRVPVRRAVHQRRGRTAPERSRGRASSTISSIDSNSVPSRRRTPSADTRKSACRQSTPFGMPVVPPVYTMYKSSGSGSTADGEGSLAASASS